MSVLERFVRMRRLRRRAAEYFEMASGVFSVDVRARYLAIADHYTALAEAELRSDKLEVKRRLEELALERARRGPQFMSTDGGDKSLVPSRECFEE